MGCGGKILCMSEPPSSGTAAPLVWLVTHRREDPRLHHSIDDKIIGVFATSEKAEAAAENLLALPGFHDAPNGFHVVPITLDQWLPDHGIEIVE